MADITVTAANVLEESNTGVKRAVGVCGETITAGMALIEKAAGGTINPTTGLLTGGVKKLFKAKNDNLENARAVGIALCDGVVDQPIVYAKDGVINFGAVFTASMTYFVSNTAGKLCPSTDIATAGECITLMGLALDASKLQLICKPTADKIA